MASDPNSDPHVPLPDELGTDQGTESSEDADQESSSSRSASIPNPVEYRHDTISESQKREFDALVYGSDSGDEGGAGPEAAANSIHGTDTDSQSTSQGGSDHAAQSQDSSSNVDATQVLSGGVGPTQEIQKLIDDFNYIIESTKKSDIFGFTEDPVIERIITDAENAIVGLNAGKLKPAAANAQINAEKKMLIAFYKNNAPDILRQITNVASIYAKISRYVARIFPDKTEEFKALKIETLSEEQITSLTKFFADSNDFKEIAEKYISDIKPLTTIEADKLIRGFLKKLYDFESKPPTPFNSSTAAKPLIETLKTLSETAEQDQATIDKVNKTLAELEKLHANFIPIVNISPDELRKLPVDVFAATKALILTELTKQDAKDIDLEVLNFMIADYLSKSKVALTQQEAKDCVTTAIKAAKPQQMCATTVTSIIRNRLLPKHSIQESLVNLREETGKSNLAYIKSPQWALPPKFGQALNDIENNKPNINALLGAYTNYKTNQTPESYNVFAQLYNTELGDSPSVFAF